MALDQEPAGQGVGAAEAGGQNAPLGHTAGRAPPPAHQKPLPQATPVAFGEASGHHAPAGAAQGPAQAALACWAAARPQAPAAQGSATGDAVPFATQ